MRAQYWFILIFGVLLALFFLAGFVLPKHYEFNRTITINANNYEVLDSLLHLETWPEWAPWNTQEDSSVKFGVVNNDGPIGSIIRWNGEYAGDGSIQITQVHPINGLSYQLFARDSSFRQVGNIEFEVLEDSITQVTWNVKGEIGSNPIVRIIALSFPAKLAPAYVVSLEQLKNRLEH